MRLIDADLLKQNCKCTGGFNDNFMCVDLITLAEVIDNQPTAFDTEKVIEQLEQYANGKICNMHRDCPYNDNENILCENCGALGAIDIVKKGGVE